MTDGKAHVTPRELSLILSHSGFLVPHMVIATWTRHQRESVERYIVHTQYGLCGRPGKFPKELERWQRKDAEPVTVVARWSALMEAKNGDGSGLCAGNP